MIEFEQFIYRQPIKNPFKQESDQQDWQEFIKDGHHSYSDPPGGHHERSEYNRELEHIQRRQEKRMPSDGKS